MVQVVRNQKMKERRGLGVISGAFLCLRKNQTRALGQSRHRTFRALVLLGNRSQ